MDPNFVGSAYKFEDDVLLSDLKDWGVVNGNYRYPRFDFNAGDPFSQYDANSLGFAQDSILHSGGSSEPVVSSTHVNAAEDAAVSVSEPFSAATTTSMADPSLEDTDNSETVRYIRQILMEENFDEIPCMYYDPISLQDTEKSFYDILKENLPLSPNEHPLDIHNQSLECPDGVSSRTTTDSGSSTHILNSQEFKAPSPETPVSGDHLPSISHMPSQNPLPQHDVPANIITDGVFDYESSVTKLLAQNIFSDADSILQFKRGLEEASKFLPPGPQLFTGMENSTVSSSEDSKVEAEKVALVKVENSHGLKSRKNHEREGGYDVEEERSHKQPAASVEEESELSEMFDQVLLSVENVPLSSEQQDGSVTNETHPNEPQPHSSERGGKTKKSQGRKKETVDLRTLLVLCAQAVSAGDNRTANDLLKQIRQNSYPLGDASQRLAHWFANGLEARMAGTGTGTQIFYTSLSYKKFTAADFLKAYQVFISACPFKKFAHFFANKTIMKAAEKAETIHIIDFGILYGFQWPILIKLISKRSGGPPKLRITGIEYPQAGFRPVERIEETGRRLANYCKRFNVPFEYKAIASRNWETIQIDDLQIRRDEFLAVNCLVRFKNLLDDTIEVNSPRNAVLNLIKRINPNIFTQSIVNGSYNAPFFVTRFKEALFHYSANYDMFDTLISRENKWRLMLEREFLGREIMNVVACEGFERVERPETYKQWQARNTRAGFRQLPLDKEMMARFKEKIREWYQKKDFDFGQDNNWMIQGWKGRILYASTCWVPA